jgi:hypothetical protein
VAASLRDAKAVSGVVIVRGERVVLVSSDAFVAFAGARCACGADALVDVHEVYRRTHGGAAPARLLAGVGLGRALRGRCPCGERLDRSRVHADIEEPFARFAVLVDDADDRLLKVLQRVTGPRYRRVEVSANLP